jgi:hypothetical protein
MKRTWPQVGCSIASATTAVAISAATRFFTSSAHIPRMAPSAPPLTRGEFVSLRDGAKGLLHRIPSEHKGPGQITTARPDA